MLTSWMLRRVIAFTLAAYAASFSCNDCEAHGYKPDLCDCGVCGSWGGCSFSCQSSAPGEPGPARVECDQQESSIGTKVTLNDEGAQCLDGSQAVYYISRGSDPSSFYIYHQGGGWCQTAEECGTRAQSALGSSKSYPGTKNLRTSATLMERNTRLNPLMSNWTFVYLPYCDGGSFSGDNFFLGDSKTSTLQFRGKRIREAVVEHLRENEEFSAARNLVIGGCSAGGAATFFHVDWYAARAPMAKVRGMPQSGWFVPGDYARDGKPHYEERMKNMFSMINASSSLSSACVAALGHKCLFAENVIGFTSTPVFALNSRYDASMASGTYADGRKKYSCTSYTGVPCDSSSVNQFGAYIESSMKERMVQGSHGVFLDSAYRHCSIGCTRYDSGVVIDGKTSGQAMAEWYRKGSAGMRNGGFFDGGESFPCASCCPAFSLVV